MHLRLRYEQPGGAVEAVQLEVGAEATVGDVAASLADLGADATPGAESGILERLTLQISDTPMSAHAANPSADSGRPVRHIRSIILDPTASFSSLGIANGVVLRVVPVAEGVRRPSSSVASLRLEVVGTHVHEQHTVAGRHAVLGRSLDCDVTIADATVSRRHLQIAWSGDRIELVNLSSSNGLMVDGRPVSHAVCNRTFEAQLGAVTVRGSIEMTDQAIEDAPAEIADFAERPCVRAPRIEPKFEPTTLTAPPLPRARDSQPVPWVSLVAPLAVGITLFAITRSMTAVLFVAVSPLLMFGNWLAGRVADRRRVRRATLEFLHRLTALEHDLAAALSLERDARCRASPSLDDLLCDVEAIGPLLWSRRPSQEAFLRLRLGTATTSADTSVHRAHRGEGDILRGGAGEDCEVALARVFEGGRTIDAVPVADGFSQMGALGVTGLDSHIGAYVRALLMQLAALHAPSEVEVRMVLGPESSREFEALIWLPHVAMHHGDCGAGGDAGGVSALEAIEALIENRARRDRATEEVQRSVVVVIAHDATIDRGRAMEVLGRGVAVGVHSIWLCTTHEALPAMCQTFVAIGRAGETGRIGFVREGEELADVTLERLSPDEFSTAALAIARLVEVTTTGRGAADLPRSVALLDLLGGASAESAASVVDRWNLNRRMASLAVPIGVGVHGVQLLDIRAQGPHAIVAGTSGSGKSEFLQAWVLALAATFSPSRVTMLLIDYKGGSAFAECARLPHCVGLVTDLGDELVQRVLISLRAEVRRRERILNDAKAKDIRDLESRGHPDCPPALVIVVDEFAALATEAPACIDGMVDIAQRGRSLGIHLVLATQRPAGVITNAIRANADLRIALRVTDLGDSSDVLGSSASARIDPLTPGRAFMKSGPSALVEFQSAFASADSSGREGERMVHVGPISLRAGPAASPRTRGPRRPADQRPADGHPTDQHRMVSTMLVAAHLLGLAAPHRPWLPPLAPSYDVRHLQGASDRELALGVLDQIESQDQVTANFLPDEDGHLAVFGPSGSGKTTVLLTMAAAAGLTTDGLPTHVYAIDFASGRLSILEPLPYVGGVISGHDSERIRRLSHLLQSAIDDRIERYSAMGVSAFSEARARGVEDAPRILVLIDGFAAFRREYEGMPSRSDAFETFQRAMALGRALGIHVILTAERSSVLPSALAAFVKRTVTLGSVADDLTGAGIAPRGLIGDSPPPGRGVLGSHVVHCAMVGGAGDTGALRSWIVERSRSTAAAANGVATAIRRLPRELDPEALLSVGRTFPVLGLADADLCPLEFDPTGVMIVAGPPRSGRTTALAWLARSLEHWNGSLRMVLAADRGSTLSLAVPWRAVLKTPDEVAVAVQDLVREEDVSTVLVVERLHSFVDTPAEPAIREALRSAKRGQGLVIAEAESREWASSYGLIGEAKSARRGIVLRPEPHDGELILHTAFPPIPRNELPAGRGFSVEAGVASLVQLPNVLSSTSVHTRLSSH